MQTSADLKVLCSEQSQKSTRYEAFQAGGGGIVVKEEIQRDNCTSRWEDPFLQIQFHGSGAFLEATSSSLKLPQEWENYSHLSLDVSGISAPVELHLIVLGARCQLQISKKMTQAEKILLALDDLPLAAGIRPLYEPTGIRICAHWNDGSERIITINELSLLCSSSAAKKPCVDQFGQRIRGNWQGKIQTIQDLKSHLENETIILAKLQPPPALDPFGGWTAGPRFEGTGFFRVAQDQKQRWWFVTPMGNPFWSIGATGVRTTDCTPVTGREFLFEKLPSSPEEKSLVMDGNNLCFYKWNILRKYGNLDSWMQRVLDRFSRWGLNSFGSWTEECFLQQRRIPHTRFILTLAKATRPAGERINPDVFSREWQEEAIGRITTIATENRDNPWLIGYFIDNEIQWHNLKLLQHPTNSPVRDEWIKLLKERYHSLEELNQQWSSSFRSWDSVHSMSQEQLPREGAAAKDMEELVFRYARTYFATLIPALRKHDPNHLYLGCRFVRKAPHPEIVRIAAGYCDVLTVNCYALYPARKQFTEWHQMAGNKPILIGEHHLPLLGERQLPPLYPAFTAEERKTFYLKFIEEWARMPFSLGCHWFQHADQNLTGRPSDGEDQIIGLVDITDQPHRELVEAALVATRSMYQWHQDSL